MENKKIEILKYEKQDIEKSLKNDCIMIWKKIRHGAKFSYNCDYQNKEWKFKLEYEVDDNGNQIIKNKKLNINDEKNDKYFKLYIQYFLQLYFEHQTMNINTSFFDEKEFRLSCAIIQFLSLENVLEVDEETMFELANMKYKKHNKQKTINLDDLNEERIFTEIPIIRKIEAMGLFFPHLNLKNLSVFSKDVINAQLNEKQENYLNNVIFICPENIKFFKDNLENEDKVFFEDNSKNENNETSNCTILEKLVFSHELGHLIFNYIENKNRSVQEKQANLVSSYFNKGILDKEIKTITNYQLKEYQNPLLISNRLNEQEFSHNVENLYMEDI